LEGKTLPDGVQKRLSRARELADRGASALAGGKDRAALGAALAAADLIRSLSPRYRAGKAIQRATRALRAAHDAVKADPSDAEKETLGKAKRTLGAARGAFEGREFGKAFKLAVESARLSLEVLQNRSGG
jgi:hypothetical protein